MRVNGEAGKEAADHDPDIQLYEGVECHGCGYLRVQGIPRGCSTHSNVKETEELLRISNRGDYAKSARVGGAVCKQEGGG